MLGPMGVPMGGVQRLEARKARTVKAASKGPKQPRLRTRKSRT